MAQQPKAPTRAQFDKAIADFGRESLKLNRVLADQARKIEQVTSKFAAEIQQLTASIGIAEATAKQYLEACASDLLPEGKSSLMIGQVQVGKRKTPAALTLCEGCNWEDVTRKIGEKFPVYVKTVTALDKENLKAAIASMQEQKTPPAMLRKLTDMGVELKSDTRYFVTLKPAS